MDGLPFDNHAVTEVYLDIMGKWVLLDATINAYFVDESKRALSLLEFRDCLINGKTIDVVYCDRFSKSGARRSQYGQSYKEEEFMFIYIKNMYVLEYYRTYGDCFDDSVCYRLVPPLYMQNSVVKILHNTGYEKVYYYTENSNKIYFRPQGIQ
jgi:hypothetical protein